MHRYEVIVDGETLDHHEFKAQPQPGHAIEFPNGDIAIIDHIRHNFNRGKLQAWCTKQTPKTTSRQLSKEKPPV